MKYIIPFLLLFFFASFISAPDTEKTTVSFRVIDSCRNEVIPFATAVLFNKEKTIEIPCSKYGLGNVEVDEGVYVLKVFSIGYVSYKKSNVVIKGKQPISMTVSLKILCQ